MHLLNLFLKLTFVAYYFLNWWQSFCCSCYIVVFDLFVKHFVTMFLKVL